MRSLLALWTRKISALRHESEARAAYEQGRFEDALTHARALYEFDRENPWANFLLACDHLESDGYAQALGHLETVAAAWPEDAWTHYAIGICQDRQERPREAVAAYRRSLELSPGRIKAYKYLGHALYLIGDYPAAEAALRHYCVTSPDDREAHDLLGYLCYRQGKFMASFGHYERARSLDPLNPKLERNARLLYSRSALS